MRNRKLLFISVLLFMVVLSIGAISAQDADDAIASNSNDVLLGDSQSVSGGVDFETENPWNTSGELEYYIPSNAKSIKSADVYVNVYSGSAQPTYGANANITITAGNNETKHFETLWIEDGSTDGAVYIVNDHTTKCYSDYMIHYDITSMVNGLSGTNLKINVDTFQFEDKQFDGKIKLIALILAYDDGDGDSIGYWINDNQLWTKTNTTVTFDTENVVLFTGATLKNVVLSSGDGSYLLNGEFLGDSDAHVSGNYYQYNEWDVTGEFKPSQKTDLDVLYAGTSAWGSIKNVLSVLTVNLEPEITVATEYTSVPTVYAGTNNTLTVKVKSPKAGDYTVRLYADGADVGSADVTLEEDVQGTVLLTDPTIRPVDETTVNGAENNVVRYTVEVSANGTVFNTKEVTFPILYNGNLGSDYEYNITGFEEFAPITVSGDVVFDVKDVSSYLGAAAMNRTDSWTISLDNTSVLTNAFVYVPYNWFNAKAYTEDVNMFDVTFNDATVTPIAWYRDQGNLGNYGKYGYGVLVYDVSDLIAIGDNSFVLNKVNPTPAVYPSVLVYMYDTPGSGTLKTVNILNGADLLANSYNVAGRTVKADTEINVNTDGIADATLYVLAASAQAGESDIVFNGNVYSDVWSGTSSTTDLFTTDVTSYIEDSNSISFVATGSTILALPQFIVTTEMVSANVSMTTEYTSVPTAYAGTENTLTVKVKTSKAGEYVVKLYADGADVDSTEVILVEGAEATVLLTDPTIRPVDETTVNGAENNVVRYTVEVSLNDAVLNTKEVTLPILYNGNLGSDYEYDIIGFEEFAPITVNGDVVFDVKDVSTYLGAAAMNRTDSWTISLDNTSVLTDAFVYVPYNWFNAKAYTEDVNMFDVTFNDATVTPIAWYRDQGNLGNYGKYGYGVLVYDVSDFIAIGDNSFVLNKVNPTPAVYPSVLVYMYNTTGSSASKTVYTLNGADLLANSYNVAGRTVKADTEINVNADKIENATLYVLAASAQAGESDIVFNGNVYSDVWSGTSSTTDLFTADVTDLVEDSNSISFVATGSTILALPQFIVASNVVPEIAVTTEYTSVPTAYAGTENTLTVKVKTSKAGEYVVKLYADGADVDSTEVILVEGAEATVLLTDPTIRPVDETTVNGAENNVVRYTVEVSLNEDVLNTKEVTLPILYNGNLGSDYEYDIIGFEEFAPITVNGDVVFDVKDVSTYLGAAAMNRTDSWTINLDDNSVLTDAFVYVPYNWFNAKAYTEDVNMFDVTFNDATVTPIAWYRDQGNLGNYGKYGYGVFVYDVSDLIAVGDNSFVLNKVNPTPAVYPSVLVYMYNTTGSTIFKTANILNGADLLANSYNVAGRTVKADTEISANTNKMIDATLYVLAASAQAGESDIVFNGNVYSDVWSGTSSTTDLFTANVTGLVDSTNSISFVATGSTILALPQFVVVTVDNTKINTTLAADDITISYLEEAEIVATLTNDATGKAISNANVKVNFNGETYAVKTNSKGQAKVSISDLAVGNYTATVSYAGNSKYNPSTTTANVEITKVDIIISADYDVDANEIVANLTNSVTGKAISNANVKFDINGQSTTVKSNAKGQAKLSTTDLPVGTYTATVSYVGNSKYSPASTSVDFTVKNNMIISAVYDADANEIVATLTNGATGKVVTNAYVQVDINGEATSVKSNAKGQAIVSTADLPVGTYTATVSYAGNSRYNPVSTSVDFAVKTNVIISNIAGSENEFVATLINGATGKAVASANVQVDINGQTTTVKTNSKGQIKVDTGNLTEYTATISYKGNSKYNPASATTEIDLNKANMVISANYDAENNELVATLKNSKTGKAVSSANVKINLNGVTTTVKSDSKGKVTLSTADLEPGTYVAVVSYAGNSKYNAISTTAIVDV